MTLAQSNARVHFKRVTAHVSRMITPALVRAARGLLNWPQKTLAEAAGVGLSTLQNYEADKTTPMRANLAAIRRALEEAGVEFTADGGVRPR